MVLLLTYGKHICKQLDTLFEGTGVMNDYMAFETIIVAISSLRNVSTIQNNACFKGCLKINLKWNNDQLKVNYDLLSLSLLLYSSDWDNLGDSLFLQHDNNTMFTHKSFAFFKVQYWHKYVFPNFKNRLKWEIWMLPLQLSLFREGG